MECVFPVLPNEPCLTCTSQCLGKERPRKGVFFQASHVRSAHGGRVDDSYFRRFDVRKGQTASASMPTEDRHHIWEFASCPVWSHRRVAISPIRSASGELPAACSDRVVRFPSHLIGAASGAGQNAITISTQVFIGLSGAASGNLAMPGYNGSSDGSDSRSGLAARLWHCQE